MGQVIEFQNPGGESYGMIEYARHAIEQELEKQIEEAELVPNLKAALVHTVLAPGKRIRPLLALLLCHDLGGKESNLLPVAAALEFLHAASLIHDDLPGMDNDSIRRGRPACHIECGESTAILAGDALPALALKAVLGAPFESAQQQALCSAFAEAYLALCNGQELDVNASGEAQLLEIYRLKTGALFRLAAISGAIGARSADEVSALAADAAERLGVYFQVSDDFLDVYGTDGERGRPKGSDERNSKITCFTGHDLSYGKKILQQSESGVRAALEKLETSTTRRMNSFRYLLDTIASRLGGNLRKVGNGG